MQNISNKLRYINLPFPNHKYIPGKSIHPTKGKNGFHIPNIAKDLSEFNTETWHNSQKYLYAIDLFNFGYWWEAHEVLEDLWIQTGKTTSLAKFIQGLIQISAALLKDFQSKSQAAEKLAAKGLAKLRLQQGIFLGIDVKQFTTDVELYFQKKGLIPPSIYLNNKS